MKIDKFLKKKWSSQIQCPICNSKDLKRVSICIEPIGKLNLIVFTLHCMDDHMWNLNEFVKSELLKGE
jgi:C4-type Zn-finger protein